MRKEKNVGVNAVLNMIRQGLSVIFPLITYPYALRILHAEGIGKVSYCSSIISYFSLIAMLGVATYAVREGSKVKNDREKFNKFANEVFTINMLSTLIAYFFLFVAIVLVVKFHEYSLLLVIQSSVIVLTTLGVDWINTIYEDFAYITVRSIISHIVTLVLLFIFVKNENDYYYYAILSVVTQGIVCVTNWFYCKKYARIRLTIHPNIKTHIKPLLILFSNFVAISIYVNFDNVMLGLIKGDYYVGLYAVAVKIYTIVKNMMMAVYAVSIPRLAFYMGNGDLKSFKLLNTKMWGYLSLLLIPAGVGMACLSDEIMYFMGGTSFLEASTSLKILAFALIFSIFGGLVTTCMNIILKREKENLIATIFGSMINFGLNLFFIPKLAHNGAALTTLIAELFVFLFCWVRIPDKSCYLDFHNMIRTIKQAIIGSFLVVVVCICGDYLIGNQLLRIIINICLSVILYIVFLLVVKNTYLYEYIDKLKLKLKKYV